MMARVGVKIANQAKRRREPPGHSGQGQAVPAKEKIPKSLVVVLGLLGAPWPSSRMKGRRPCGSMLGMTPGAWQKQERARQEAEVHEG